MNETTTTVPVSIEDLERKISSLEARLDAAAARGDAFRRIIENLPWDEINTGTFHPQAGCGDVATAREEFISLGCDSSVLNEGLLKAYKVFVTVPVEMTVYVDEAVDEEDAEERASVELDTVYLSCRGGNVEVDEINTWNADFHTIEEA